MTTFLFPAILAAESVATDSVNPRLAHKNCNVARNRREHVFHRAPELTADGYPSRWHHIELHPDMWRDDFVAKARIVAKQREATRIEQERLQAEKRAQREAEIRSQLVVLRERLHASQNQLGCLAQTMMARQPGWWSAPLAPLLESVYLSFSLIGWEPGN